MEHIKKFKSYSKLVEGVYMYPIIIKKEPQIISYEKKVDLGYDSTLTLSELIEHGVTEDSSFQIIEEENSRYTLYIYLKRIETPEETEARINREEEYMKNYTAFQNRKKK